MLILSRRLRLAPAVIIGLILRRARPCLLASGGQTGRGRLLGDRLDRLTRVLQELYRSGQNSGMVSLVARKGRVAYLKPFGKLDLERGTPCRSTHIPHSPRRQKR